MLEAGLRLPIAIDVFLGLQREGPGPPGPNEQLLGPELGSLDALSRGKDGKSKQHPEVHVHPKLGVQLGAHSSKTGQLESNSKLRYVKGVADEPVDSFENCVQLIELSDLRL